MRGSLLLVFTTACAGMVPSGPRMPSTPTSLPLGDGTVEVAIHEGRTPGPTVINLHDDENTAVYAAHRVLYKGGGRLIELRHTGERNLRFNIDGVEYVVDPNRIFTARGVEDSLRKLGVHSEAAQREVVAFAERLVEIYGLDELDLVVTVHNNTEDNFTVKSFAEGGEYASDAAEVNLVAGADPDDFFFVTAREHFDALVRGGFNVVLQNNDTVTDDGSLSVLCARRGLPYINVEAQHGHLEEQVKMLEAVMKLRSPDVAMR